VIPHENIADAPHLHDIAFNLCRIIRLHDAPLLLQACNIIIPFVASAFGTRPSPECWSHTLISSRKNIWTRSHNLLQKF
jgi:hypothetical protein